MLRLSISFVMSIMVEIKFKNLGCNKCYDYMFSNTKYIILIYLFSKSQHEK
jgi:hypothetical protein